MNIINMLVKFKKNIYVVTEKSWINNKSENIGLKFSCNLSRRYSFEERQIRALNRHINYVYLTLRSRDITVVVI